MERDTLYGITVIVFLVSTAVVAYHFLEGWEWLDSVYFSIATITTVGYGDIYPITEAGKLFTIFYIILGVSTGFYTILSFGKPRETIFRNRFESVLDRLNDLSTRKDSPKEGKLVEAALTDLEKRIESVKHGAKKGKGGRFVKVDLPK